MRIVHLLAVPLLVSLAVLPAGATVQAQINIAFGTRLGPEVHFSPYSRDRQGDWRNSYPRWTLVTLYDVDGRYYRNGVRGARPILVYAYNNEYFLPPQDQAWPGLDKRYNNRLHPSQGDYNRARPYSHDDRFDSGLGGEIGVLAYFPARVGDWRTSTGRWTPVTVYEVRGRYFPNNGAGARPVSMYWYRNEYFLPPDDQAWVGADKRFDYRYRPRKDDHKRARRLGPDGQRAP